MLLSRETSKVIKTCKSRREHFYAYLGRYKSNDFLHIWKIFSYNNSDKKLINQSMVKGEIR